MRLETLRRGRWFGQLPDGLQQALVMRGHMVRRSPGSAAYRVGDPPGGLYAIVTGGVQLIAYPQPGRQVLAMAIGAGQWFGELSTLDGAPRPHDALAVTETKLLHVSSHAVNALGRECPELWQAIGVLACHRLRGALDHIGSLVSAPPDQRILQWLRALSDVADPAGPIHVSQAQIAQACGMSRQSASRILNRLQRAGLVQLTYGAVRLVSSRSGP